MWLYLSLIPGILATFFLNMNAWASLKKKFFFKGGNHIPMYVCSEVSSNEFNGIDSQVNGYRITAAYLLISIE